jgi:hypothetical protein
MGSPFHGGMWDSELRNVSVKNFTNGIWFKGGSSGYLLPNQFIKFDQVRIDRTSDTGVAFKATGQNGQFTHVGCRYQGVSGTTTGTDLQLMLDTANAPASHIFTECTFQNSDKAIEIENGENLTFLNCWFENIARSITVTSSSRAVLVENCRFANAADGGGTGYVLSSNTSSCGFKNNYVVGVADKVITATNPSSNIDASGNYITSSPTPLTSGMTKQLSVGVGGDLSLNQGNTFIVNTSATNISTITSNKLVGESVYLKAHAGSIQFATGGNISLGSATSPLVIPQNQVVQLVRFDLGGTWFLVGK